MSEVSVDTDTIKKALSLCNDAIEELTKTKEALKDAKQKSSGSWKDPKGKEFNALIEKCGNFLTNLATQLQDCATKLNAMLENLEEYGTIGFERDGNGSEAPTPAYRNFRLLVGGLCWLGAAGALMGVTYVLKKWCGIGSLDFGPNIPTLHSFLYPLVDPSLGEVRAAQSRTRRIAYQWGYRSCADFLISMDWPIDRYQPRIEQRIEVPMPPRYSDGEHQTIVMETAEGRPMTVEYWVDPS